MLILMQFPFCAYHSCQYVGYAWQWSDHCLETVLTRPQILDAPFTLSHRMGWWPCWCLFCVYKLALCWVCITATRSLCSYRTYKIKNCWRSIDAHFTISSIQHLLPWLTVFIMIWTYWWSFCRIETLPFGKAEHSNIIALFALTWLNFIYVAKQIIVPAIHLFINR